MKTIWERITLMRYCHPDDDYKITPLRLAVGIALFGVLLFGPTWAARIVGV